MYTRNMSLEEARKRLAELSYAKHWAQRYWERERICGDIEDVQQRISELEAVV